MKSLITLEPVPLPVCNYRIESGRNLHIEEYAGTVVLDDLKEMAAVAASDPAWSGQNNRLLDLSRAELDMSSNDILRFALLMRSETYRSDGWHAFAVGDASTFSQMRMFSHWARLGERSRIFGNRDEAERWLDCNATNAA